MFKTTCALLIALCPLLAGAEQYDIFLKQLNCKVSNGVEIKTTGVNSFGTTALVDTTWAGLKREAYASVIDYNSNPRYDFNAQIQLHMKSSSGAIELYFLYLKFDLSNPSLQKATGRLVDEQFVTVKLGDADCEIETYDTNNRP